MKLLMMKGLQGSGKSTYARQLVEEGGWIRVNRDSIRKFLKEQGVEWSHDVEKRYVIPERDKQIRDGLRNNLNVVVDDTNLSPKNEDFFRGIAKEYGAEFEVRSLLHVPIATCIERDKYREEKVGEEVIMKTARQYGLVGPPEYVNGNPDVVIVDLDGTLALHKGRSPYDEERCGEDLLNRPVATVLHALFTRGYKVLYVSGRHDTVKTQTLAWLEDNKLPTGKLLMRKENDNRNDAVVKKEIYDTHIKGKYNVLLVLDDRDRVVKMWRNEGLTCLQVAEGDF